VWYAILIVAQNYIWCAEKTKIGSLPLGIGLVANILLNLVLLPIWGLYGAVFATTLSTGLALGLLYWLNQHEGMQLQSGLLWLSAAPVALGGGAWSGAAVLVALLVAAPFSKTLFTADERAVIGGFLRHQLEIVNGFLTRRPKRVGA
jgi:O-antigen/teichoic acid export membrane protein